MMRRGFAAREFVGYGAGGKGKGAAMFLDAELWQAPMAGISTPQLTAAVLAAGGLGQLPLGALDAAGAAVQIATLRGLTDAPFGLNLFCNMPPRRDAQREARWLETLTPAFAAFGAQPPAMLDAPYVSFRVDDAMMRAVIAARPALVSFHFGLPRADQIAAIRAMGARMVATATSRAEAQAIRRAGLDGIVAQGWQAGGHRGIYDPDGPDERLETLDLVAQIAGLGLPVIAAGGIMSPADIAAARAAGAAAVQCGTAFLRCPEALTSPAHRAGLSAGQTMMTRAISGRPARGLANRWTQIDGTDAPDYPVTYAAGKALNAAAVAAGDAGFGAFWAGTGAAEAREEPAAQVVARLLGQSA